MTKKTLLVVGLALVAGLMLPACANRGGTAHPGSANLIELAPKDVSFTKIAQGKNELTMEFQGYQGLGWEGDNFAADELENVRDWLWGKAISIYGGSFEVQYNIISKNILGLPETTQKG